MNFIFYRAKSLTNFDLFNCNIQNVTNMIDILYGFISLTNIDLSKFDTQNVISMNYVYVLLM